MMLKTWLPSLNFVIMAFLLFLSCGLQTTFWFQIFGDFPAPLLWLIFIFYLALYRRPFAGLLGIYAFGFFAASFSGMPYKMMFTTSLTLFGLIHLIKSRIFWTGPMYFTLMSAFGTVSYNIIYLALSHLLEKNPAPWLIFIRGIEIVLTPIFAYFLYFPLSYLDRWTIDNVTTESGGLEA